MLTAINLFKAVSNWNVQRHEKEFDWHFCDALVRSITDMLEAESVEECVEHLGHAGFYSISSLWSMGITPERFGDLTMRVSPAVRTMMTRLRCPARHILSGQCSVLLTREVTVTQLPDMLVVNFVLVSYTLHKLGFNDSQIMRIFFIISGSNNTLPIKANDDAVYNPPNESILNIVKELDKKQTGEEYNEKT